MYEVKFCDWKAVWPADVSEVMELPKGLCKLLPIGRQALKRRVHGDGAAKLLANQASTPRMLMI